MRSPKRAKEIKERPHPKKTKFRVVIWGDELQTSVSPITPAIGKKLRGKGIKLDFFDPSVFYDVFGGELETGMVDPDGIRATVNGQAVPIKRSSDAPKITRFSEQDVIVCTAENDGSIYVADVIADSVSEIAITVGHSDQYILPNDKIIDVYSVHIENYLGSIDLESGRGGLVEAYALSSSGDELTLDWNEDEDDGSCVIRLE